MSDRPLAYTLRAVEVEFPPANEVKRQLSERSGSLTYEGILLWMGSLGWTHSVSQRGGRWWSSWRLGLGFDRPDDTVYATGETPAQAVYNGAWLALERGSRADSPRPVEVRELAGE